MIRCITKEQASLFASNCEEKSTKNLSRTSSLLCPNCLTEVRFNKGPLKGAYFSHIPGANCVVTNYEKETKQHLQGKDILYKWLTSRFKDAIVKLEVYIPETNQIADILVTHTTGEAKDTRWAFEFQHSPLASKDWEQRHNLYKEANIHDFWIFDADKFLLYSNSKDPYIQKSRRRKDPVETVYTTTGFCYFLELDNSEITVDFSFRYEDIRGEDKNGRRFPPQEYKFHSPPQHKCKLNDVNFLYNKEFNYTVLSNKDNSKEILNKFKAKIEQFKREKQKKWDEELQIRARQKKEYAETNYGKDFASYMWSFMKANREDIKHEVFNLIEEDFFSKYNKYAKKLQKFGEEIVLLEKSSNVNHRIILRLYDKEILMKMKFIEIQELSIEDFLTDKYSHQIQMVNYVLNEHDSVLEIITSRNPKIISEKLRSINRSLNPYKDNPSKFDYAFEYYRYKSKEEVDKIFNKLLDSLKPTLIDMSKL